MSTLYLKTWYSLLWVTSPVPEGFTCSDSQHLSSEYTSVPVLLYWVGVTVMCIACVCVCVCMRACVRQHSQVARTLAW